MARLDHFEFVVKGHPVEKGRPKFTVRNGHAAAYTPKATQQGEQHVAACYRLAAGWHDIDPLAWYRVDAVFYLPDRRRRDVDNLLKLLLDGLNGVAWKDDAQVMMACGRKVLACPEPHTSVRITELRKEP
jgi:crossover junction endodeoxyribonuclease RusA